jgi:hypothetical protein
MKNEHDESSKWILGLLIGGVVGAGALYCVHAAQNRKTPVLKKIGKTIVDVGEMLESCDLNSGTDVLEGIEKKLPKGAEIVNNITDWVDTGLTLWKKFKKG